MPRFLAAAFLLVTSVACASPCDGINRSMADERKAALSPQIAKQLNVREADVLQLFSYGVWSVIYADTHESDEVFLFYEGDPLSKSYVTLWSGAARVDEEQEIKGWTLKNAPGIPQELASCFAWYVTKGRDQ